MASRFCCALLALMLCAATPARAELLLQFTGSRPQLAQQVKDEFRHAWNGYANHAWGYDDLQPLSLEGSNWFGPSLLMTPVDAYSTMKLMGLESEAEQAKALIFAMLSFDVDAEVQVFEVNIRLLGGLLSAYQLDGDERFLQLATQLGNKLMPAFDSPTGVPYRYVNLNTGATRDPLNNPAEIGTLLLEFGTLSRHTGEPRYYDAVKRAVRYVYGKRSQLDLVGTILNVETGEWTNTESHIGARIDSWYEYLLKGALMFGDEELREMWRVSIDAVQRHVAHRVGGSEEGALWYGQVDMNTGERTGTHFGALEAFFPGLLALSGDLRRARDLQESCYRMWTLHGIEPEVIDYTTMEILYDGYVLRPENIESAYYLHHFTGDQQYLEMGRQYFASIVEHCRTPEAYAALRSVVNMEQRDGMQSFFLAETLKYAYLLFAPEGTVDWQTTLFNTEAHPLRIWGD